mmetsp:Transcript_5068/g.8617  ORF Transcript_5068/g.8617 Transcript_5068/m.8617 type:complete len:221 (+) Transcript_5068:96-758(+)|eukprot:CAMPEP_0197727218 /NCGR_PEP_ID=MMETSP1434-20131217/18803_1 /TAXON_ID=265543 /ORGANISM="Minutocellus polymorphus, Strain CCMP3303" /LENGTH=220 /DNA_ID=CAMNT_0043313359 /DNA_START=94 /DNA_END=756 /DNA_ORIENTATION=+
MPPKQRARSPSRLTPIFTVLNAVAFAGWLFILYKTITLVLPTFPSIPPDLVAQVQPQVIFLEGICVIEVIRIAVGDLPGNLVLGAVLHTIRLITITQVMPNQVLSSHWTAPAILLSWAVTEVSRYPMYIFPGSGACRSVRMVTPLVTFPVGCIAEGAGAYLVLTSTLGDVDALWLKAMLAAIIFVNGVLGPTMAYPALLKKGLPVLGIGKKKTSSSKKRE